MVEVRSHKKGESRLPIVEKFKYLPVLLGSGAGHQQGGPISRQSPPITEERSKHHLLPGAVGGGRKKEEQRLEAPQQNMALAQRGSSPLVQHSFMCLVGATQALTQVPS